MSFISYLVTSGKRPLEFWEQLFPKHTNNALQGLKEYCAGHKVCCPHLSLRRDLSPSCQVGRPHTDSAVGPAGVTLRDSQQHSCPGTHVSECVKANALHIWKSPWRAQTLQNSSELDRRCDPTSQLDFPFFPIECHLFIGVIRQAGQC